MRFVTFEVQTSLGPIQRLGLWRNKAIVDLNGIYSVFLREVRGIYRWKELALAIVPPDMLSFIEGGELSMQACRTALEYFDNAGSLPTGQYGERLLYS
jgi:hypothetical protein